MATADTDHIRPTTQTGHVRHGVCIYEAGNVLGHVTAKFERTSRSTIADLQHSMMLSPQICRSRSKECLIKSGSEIWPQAAILARLIFARCVQPFRIWHTKLTTPANTILLDGATPKQRI